MKEEKLDSKDCFVVKSTPKAADMEYRYKISWIDKDDFLPLKEEYYDKKGELYKVFTANEIKDVKGFPTHEEVHEKPPERTHDRSDILEDDYNVGIDDSLFSERFLKQPPKRWIE